MALTLSGLQDWLPVLIELCWKSVVILAVAGGVTLVLGRASAAWRHLVWRVGLAGILVLPFLGSTLPRLTPAWARFWPDVLRETPVPTTPAGEAVRAAGSDAAPANPPAHDAATPFAPARAAQPMPGGRPVPVGTWLVGIWGAGVVLVLLRLGVGLAGVWWIGRHGTTLDDASWLGVRDAFCRSLGLRRRPHLCTSARVATPATWGLLSPVIVLPEGAETWPAEQRRMVLAHELAHVRRGDWPAYVLGRVATALYWPNPLVWLAVRRLRIEAEYACDDFVLREGTPRGAYARGLLDVARRARRARRHAHAVVGMARASELDRRLRAILDVGRCRTVVGRIGRWSAAGLTLAVATPLAAVHRPATPGGPAASPPVAARGPARTCDQDRWVSHIHEDSAETRRLIVRLRSDRARDRSKAAADLGNVGTREAVPALIAALADPDDHVRQFVASALGNLGDTRAVDPLVHALRSDEEHVRQAAAYALGDIGSDRAEPALAATLGDANKHVRQAAASALGYLRDPRAVPALVRLLSDSEAHVRAAALRSLGALGARATVSAVAERYEVASDPYERLEAARALGQLGDFRGVGTLAAMLQDDSEQFLRRDAAWALGAIAGTSDTLRRRLVDASPGAAAALRHATEDESVYVHYAAACSLGRLGDPNAEDALRRLRQNTDTDAAARAAAAWALEHLGARR